MKFTHIFYVFGLLSCLLSCSKDGYEPYTPAEWQYDKYSDSGILPGDDFYRYVCGKGIASEGSDSWAPFSLWGQREKEYLGVALSDDNNNPVPVIKRLNELKKASLSAEAFASMRSRLNGITERTEDKEFPEKAAEYCLNGYALFLVTPMLLDGHRFGFGTAAVFLGILKEWNEQQLELAGIEEEYNNLLPKARTFEKYLLDNIKDDEQSINDLDAGNSDECRQLRNYVDSYVKTKAGSGSAFRRFAMALGNRNPEFVPADNLTRQYFELVDKMEDAEMKTAADAFLWCAAVSLDMDLILNASTQANFFITLLYPNLRMNISHTFCEMYSKPECGALNREIFDALRSTMAERIEHSEWMSPYTKTVARKKIDAMECHTGLLDWAKYEADMPVSGDFCSALHEVGHSNITKLMDISGENTNLDHIIASLYMAPTAGFQAYSANSFYLQNVNAMCILPSTSILMDMNPELPFLTFVIGHEMCHGFDANGANFNERGELGDWWSVDDKLAFKEKQDQLTGIFNQYYVGGTTFCNGVKTITEDMADLGGLEIAYYTKAKELEGKCGGEELLEMKRRVFKSYAVFWAKYSSTDEKIEQVGKDVHSINEYRVNGIVNNIDDWYQLYDVSSERKLYLSPERRVQLW